MKYRYLGSSGLAVSTVCLGTMTFGNDTWGSDSRTSTDILSAFVEQGGNFIDTADQYNCGVSEQIIGKWLSSQKRDDMVIGTKCSFQVGNDINSRGLSRKHIIKACEASLRRLNTDYIDLYQIYGFDPQTPLDETMSALDFLVQQGKVRYLGVSNLPAWKVMKLFNIAQNKNYSHFISGQYLYNLLKRDIESEILPACDDVGMGMLCWSPLSGGMLTGKYTDSDNPPDDTRLSLRADLSHDKYKIWYEKSSIIVNKLREIAKKNNQSVAVVALSWLLKQHNVASVVVGARKKAQLIDNCKAGEWVISNDAYRQLSELSQVSYGHSKIWNDENSKDWFDNIL